VSGGARAFLWWAATSRQVGGRLVGSSQAGPWGRGLVGLQGGGLVDWWAGGVGVVVAAACSFSVLGSFPLARGSGC
jgi:hypothetical protein